MLTYKLGVHKVSIHSIFSSLSAFFVGCLQWVCSWGGLLPACRSNPPELQKSAITS